MNFVRKAWKILVAIKDGLVLAFMLLFFVLLFAALSARPTGGFVRDGALLVELDGTVVEEPATVDPFAVLTSGQAPIQEYRAADVIRAIEGAATDDRIKAVVLDLDRFMGAGQTTLTRMGEALDKVRKAKKPVLAYATGYGDDGYQLAAHADEIWVNPLGGLLVAGPGGNRLYYRGLLDQLDVTVNIYKVGTFKSAVEPYSRNDQSPEAKQALEGVYGPLWESYRAEVAKARPKAKLDAMIADPVGAVQAAKGDLALAAKQAGLVDTIGDRVAFGKRVAKIAGEEDYGLPGNFKHTPLNAWLGANAPDQNGDPIAVVTIAGEIVDGEAGPGMAGGTRIAGLLDEALQDEDIKALVVRVDSPGGSVTASEEIRLAIQRYRDKKIPVVVSMGNLAASGGYWVSTASDHIMADPNTITGSIGIFAVVPTFEKALAKWGVNSDGVRTTSLSGQPDLAAGFTPEVNAILQANIEAGYTRFLNVVAKARGKTPEQIDTIGQGRIWDGGTARQLGLVDSLGDLDDALAEAAKRAKLGEGDYHARYLTSPVDPFAALLTPMVRMQAREAGGQDMFARVAQGQQTLLGQVLSDLDGLTKARGMQARCLECAVMAPPRRVASDGEAKGVLSWLGLLAG